MFSRRSSFRLGELRWCVGGTFIFPLDLFMYFLFARIFESRVGCTERCVRIRIEL
jgi:hypothetical protein